MTRTIISLCALIIFSSCGGSKRTSHLPIEWQSPLKKEDHLLDSDIKGQYLAVLKPVTPLLAGKIRGAVTLSREDDEIVGDVWVMNAFPGMVFAQSVRRGSRCPDINDDRNADGFVDAKEGEEAYGKILIPMDGDLSSQSSMAQVFPLSDVYGGYIYSKTASFSSLMRDLRADDLNDQDDYVKLATTEALALENRVVVIQGIPKDYILPETIQTTRDQVRYQTLPIACGVIKKVLMAPGIPEGSSSGRLATEVAAEDILTGIF